MFSDKQSNVIGYKGDFEQRLCHLLGCFGVNIEFLDCPKYENLFDLFFESGKKENNSCDHFNRCGFVNKTIVHCSIKEVRSFSCYVLKNHQQDYSDLIRKYGCCW